MINTINEKVYVIVIIDGASDRLRVAGKSPLEIAKTPALDSITTMSNTGLVQTLYKDLSKDSVVAQLGILGYDPYRYFPKGRSYFEVPDHVKVQKNDLIFRVNLVSFNEKSVLKSYNGFGISSLEASSVVEAINEGTSNKFPEFELYNISDFRNILIIRNINEANLDLYAEEPHESEEKKFDQRKLITSKTNAELAQRINNYISCANPCITKHAKVNSIFPWGYSQVIQLPLFSKDLKGVLIGNMDFLNGFSRDMGLSFVKIGNSNWNTDYIGKGSAVLQKIEEGYTFIYCHINGPDEASHMNDLGKKVFSIEQTDKHIFSPIASYFKANPERLGAVVVCPDHYTNINWNNSGTRREAHSIEAVPFLIWDNKQKDDVTVFSEDAVLEGMYGKNPVNHLELLHLMGIQKENPTTPEKTGEKLN